MKHEARPKVGRKRGGQRASLDAVRKPGQFMFHYVLSMGLFAVGVLFFVFVCWRICSQFIWQPYDILYQMLNTVREHLFFCVGTVLLSGWLGISYYFLSKPVYYLNRMAAAAEQLAQAGQEPVALPPQLKHVEDKLNLVREQALRSAMLAKEAEQRKNDLIVYLAHDLKTPLTSVIGYLSLLRDEPQISGELRTRYTGIALEKAERLEELINEFFDITRFNLAALTLEPERVFLSRMLEQVAYEFNPLLAEKGLCWHTEIEPDIWLYCDADKLERVLDNLIRNAVGYSYPQTEIFLSLKRASAGEADGKGVEKEGAVEILVRNHGKTIPPDKLGRIFEQFFRLDSSRASTTGGAGLGLAIAKEIVELHGGSIRAESAKEQVTFTVWLPEGGM